MDNSNRYFKTQIILWAALLVFWIVTSFIKDLYGSWTTWLWVIGCVLNIFINWRNLKKFGQ